MHVLEDLSTYWKNCNLKRGRGLLLWGITCVIYKCWPKKKRGTCYLVISLNLEVQKNVLNNSSTCPEDGSEKEGATTPCLKEPQKGGKELTHLLILDVLKSVKLRNFYNGSTYNSFFFPSHYQISSCMWLFTSFWLSKGMYCAMIARISESMYDCTNATNNGYEKTQFSSFTWAAYSTSGL